MNGAQFERRLKLIAAGILAEAGIVGPLYVDVFQVPQDGRDAWRLQAHPANDAVVEIAIKATPETSEEELRVKIKSALIDWKGRHGVGDNSAV
jgi:hypothetical protein